MIGAPSQPLIVLDADGVFMNEMTYWRTALAAALTLADITVPDAATWHRLDQACLHTARLQRITKSRACNSNWDLAAVMAEALTRDDTRRDVIRQLSAGNEDQAAAQLAQGMERLWTSPVPGQPPLSGFGIDRDGPRFHEVRQRFEDILYHRLDVGWSFPRHELLPPAEVTRGALARLHEAGLTLTVCTSRGRDETQQPIRTLGLAGWLNTARMATYDDVQRAQDATGCKPLGKPHWFPLTSAVLGYDTAERAVRSNARTLPVNGCGPVVFVGDASADFECALAAHDRGLPVTYIHIDSGISRPETLAAIRDSSITAALVPDLSAAADVILERQT